MAILEKEVKSTETYGEIEYGETRFAEIDNFLLEEYENAFRDYFRAWI